ncbi:hypothetical protein GCM10023321_77640 [Pseudonocardia eucalypti]|uniref:ESX secretion-associated protein EspG n=1 Tax=Pseudonocardia eucalypti TaxID=648755 RepID=A0ABP9RC41_9PSEU|nr:hypothetical protein [Pseudonocardia eucalypti]
MIVQTPSGIVLSPTELLACWESLRLGDPPVWFRLRRPGWTARDRVESDNLLRSALVGLAERGLSDGARPSPHLARLLGLIDGAEYQLDIRYTNPDGSLRPILGFGAVDGFEGVVVVSNDGAGPIRLRPVDGARVAAELLGSLGKMQAGYGQVVNIPADVLDDATAQLADPSNFVELADGLRRRGVSSHDASVLARMCTGADAGGQLGATSRSNGRTVRGPWVIGFHRIQGRYFMQLRRGGFVTVSPADSGRLYDRWLDLVAELRPRRGSRY